MCHLTAIYLWVRLYCLVSAFSYPVRESLPISPIVMMCCKVVTILLSSYFYWIMGRDWRSKDGRYYHWWNVCCKWQVLAWYNFYPSMTVWYEMLQLSMAWHAMACLVCAIYEVLYVFCMVFMKWHTTWHMIWYIACYVYSVM